MSSMLAGVILAALNAVAGTAPEPSADWETLRGAMIGKGCRAQQVDPVLNTCRARGLSPEQVDRLLEPVRTAQLEQLPTDCLYARIDEGLAKKIDPARIVAATDRRLECLHQARAMLEDAAPAHPGGPPQLVTNLAMALESGVPPDVLGVVFQGKGRMRYGRLAHVVEAAESLYLSGLDADQLRRVIADFVSRSMSRPEVVRVVGIIQQGLAHGQDFETVYASVWGNSVTPQD